MPATTAETLSLVTRTVSVAPLVLLSAADHYGRQAKGTRKRVVGVLLGQNDGNNVRVSNSFAGVFMADAPFAAEHRSGGGGEGRGSLGGNSQS
jgi:26S proteasome regulatory subunit N8